MTPRDRNRLRIAAAELARLGATWDQWTTGELPDGYPTSCPGSGSAGVAVNTISDPTYGAGTSRALTTVERDRAASHARQLADLTTSLWRAAREDRRGTLKVNLSPTSWLMLASEAAKHTSEIWRTILDNPNVWLWDAVGEDWQAETVGDVINAIESHLNALGRVMRVRVDISRELDMSRCADPVCEALAVRRGLCWQHYRAPVDQ